MAVGSPLEDSNGTGINSGAEGNNSAASSGAVYVFTRTDGMWNPEAYIKASNADRGDYFGGGVTMSRDTLAVGAPDEDSNGTGVDSGAQANNDSISAGAVYVFTRGDGEWSQQAYIKSSDNFIGRAFWHRRGAIRRHAGGRGNGRSLHNRVSRRPRDRDLRVHPHRRDVE